MPPGAAPEPMKKRSEAPPGAERGERRAIVSHKVEDPVIQLCEGQRSLRRGFPGLFSWEYPMPPEAAP